MAVHIQLRSDSSANWSMYNPTLAMAEIGVETDTLRFKMGDGATPWTSLTYTDFNSLSELSLKAPIASPAFTGAPTAPTPSSSDNSTKLATTAYATTAVTSLRAYILTLLALKEDLANKGVSGGYASLDMSGKVPLAQIPASLFGSVQYQSTWDASANTPPLASGIGAKGFYYLVSTAGTTALDSVSQWYVNDWAIFNGAEWERVSNNGEVLSVNGYTGTVTLTKADVGLSNATNTSDANKPVSTAQGLADAAVQAYAIQRANHTGTQPASTITGLAAVATSGLASDVGLGNANNTSDANKPVSTAQAAAIALKANASTAPNSIKGNNTGSTASVADLTIAQATAMLNTAMADGVLTAGLQGLVPAAPANATESGSFLTGSGFKHVDQSKPRPAPFTLWNQAAAPAGMIKFQEVTLATINGVQYAICAGTSAATISIYNISNPAAPALKSSMALLGTYGIAVQGNYAYIPSSGGYVLYIVNIADPTNLTVAGSVNIGSTSGSLYYCVVSGNYCYVSTQSKGLTVIDVTNPASPSMVWQEGGTLNKSFGIAINGNTLYTTNYQTVSPWTVRYFKTWDISTPTNPTLLNTYTLPANTKPNGITLWSHYAAVTDTNQMLVHILDATSPSAPSFLFSIAPSGVFNSSYRPKMSGNYLYLPSGQNSTDGGYIDLFDVSGLPSVAPTKIATVKTGVGGSVFGGIALDLANGYIYAADYGVAPGSAGSLDVFTMPFETSTVGALTASTVAAKSGFAYSPATPGNWSGAVPTTVQQALDRMAALLVTLNSGNPVP
jgi:hypothetical protein